MKLTSITNSRWDDAQTEEARWWSKEFLIKQNNEIEQKFSNIFNTIEQEIGIKEDWKILDVACGPTCISLLFDKGEKYGIDTLLDEYEKNLTLPDGIELSVGTGEEINFEDNFFDIVVCRNALDHTYNPHQVISEIYRVMKPGGYFINSVNVCTPFITKIHRFVENKEWFVREEAHPYFFTIDEIDGIICDKFKIIKKKCINRIEVKKTDSNFVSNGMSLLKSLQFKAIFHKLIEFHFPKQFWNIVHFINKNVYRENWIEEEYCVVCRK